MSCIARIFFTLLCALCDNLVCHNSLGCKHEMHAIYKMKEKRKLLKYDSGFIHMQTWLVIKITN